ncbi:unnamed protein product, partial [Rotaria magnacalcarata]
TVCSSTCTLGQECVANVCVGTGALSFVLLWSRPGDGDLVVTIPNGYTIMYSSKESSIQSNYGQLDADDTNGVGPENIFWNSTPDHGVYFVCFQQYRFSLDASPMNPIVATVEVKQMQQVIRTFNKTFTSPGSTENKCNNMLDTYLGSITY